jgi:hypothetical protein
MDSAKTIVKPASVGKSEVIVADGILRQRAEARVRRAVAENILLDWAQEFLREHGPRVVAETKGEASERA